MSKKKNKLGWSEKVLYLVQHSDDDVLLLHLGLNGHKPYSTDNVHTNILNGHWKLSMIPG